MVTAMHTVRLTWQGIVIEARWTPRRFGIIDHLEIESVSPERAPLPVTETGYCSHFLQPGTIEAHGGDLAAQAIAWLDEEATSPDTPLPVFLVVTASR